MGEPMQRGEAPFVQTSASAQPAGRPQPLAAEATSGFAADHAPVAAATTPGSGVSPFAASAAARRVCPPECRAEDDGHDADP